MREEVGVSSPASKPFRGRLQPTLLPSGWTPPGPGGQLWNVGPVHGPRETVLDDLPIPADQKAQQPSRPAGSCNAAAGLRPGDDP